MSIRSLAGVLLLLLLAPGRMTLAHPGHSRRQIATPGETSPHRPAEDGTVQAAGAFVMARDGFVQFRRPDDSLVTVPQAYISRYAPPSVRDARPRTVLDVMTTAAGRDYWKQYGDQGAMTFDLTPGSRSMRTLAAYQAERKSRKKG